jgi:hypothetical protein
MPIYTLLLLCRWIFYVYTWFIILFLENVCSILHFKCVYLCIYDLFHIILSLWHTYWSMECMYICTNVCMSVCMYMFVSHSFPALLSLYLSMLCFVSLCWFIHYLFFFRHVCISSGKYMLALACLSVHPLLSTWLPLDGFSWNLILETFIKICPRDPDVVKMGQKCWTLYMKT